MSFLIPAVVLGPGATLWQSYVSRIVTEPYLDEVFHVRQAQVYCADRFDVWDPKITTPPGLYGLSRIIFALTGRCDITALRFLNTTSLLLSLVPIAILIGRATSSRRGLDGPSLITYHSALNVTLFPPLFFFSALYYTDVLSTILVLLHYDHTLRGLRKGGSGLVHKTISVFLGVVALLFRQTNIFWVAVFPAGLTAIQELKSHGTSESKTQKGGNASRDWSIIRDLDVEDAYVEDYMYFAIAAALTALKKPGSLLNAIVPYVSLVAIFAVFIAWNGGVVLGDKSNHVATIHVPQMLYIWPYMMFFSFPLVIPVLLNITSRYLPHQYLPSGLDRKSSRHQGMLPRSFTIVGFIMIGLLAVQRNTIIHPFTLADNRHYVFYVFRLLHRHWAVKHIAVPIYAVCAWLIIQSTGSWDRHSGTGQAISSDGRKSKLPPSTTLSPGKGSISFVTIWLATTTLSVITAPLVEPRYFIIPWAVWRINAAPMGTSLDNPKPKATSSTRWSHGILLLETMWYIFINLSTGYMFLYRGFSWPQEPGKVQRFMW